jgi:ABC-type lipoprotein export system ATPase subunit
MVTHNVKLAQQARRIFQMRDGSISEIEYRQINEADKRLF